MMILLTTSERARKLADDIQGRRRGLATEEKHLDDRGPHSSYVRSKRQRDTDLAQVNGMRIALSYLLGVPMDMQLTDEFIEDSPVWRALLPDELREEFK